MDVRREIEELVAVGGRWPGTDGERRAARHLEGRLQELGRDVKVEHIDAWPNWPVAYALFLTVAIAGSVLSVPVPGIGALLVFFATVVVIADATSFVMLPRRIAGRRASQNVVSTERADKPGTLVLVAHYDAARTGILFSRRLQERRAALSQRLKRQIGPFQPLTWSLLLLFVCCILRLFGTTGVLVTAVQFVITAVLIIAVPLLLDIAVSDPVPGANDNASGVAAALALADRYGGRLEHFDLCVVLTGAQEALCLGMRAFMRRRRRDLDRQRTVFLNIDEIGAGTVRFTSHEGAVFALSSHEQLLSFCEEIAEDDEEDGNFAARPLVLKVPSDALVARHAGFPAITICCRNALDYTPEHHRAGDVPERVDDASLERAIGFCSELIGRLDAEVGPDLRSDETVLGEAA